jgi:UDP-2,3-diacylglucosamine hydrolase
MSKTYFISDLHLQTSEPAMAELFIAFLQQRAIEAETLYILGDFFEVWIGDDDDNPFHQKIIEALQQASQRTQIYFMHGNRDFLIGKHFLKAVGCQLLKDPTCIDLYGTKTILTHGDLLCTQDKKYQRFRKYSRCWLVQKLFLLKSLAKRKQIAKNYREKSKQYTATTANHIMDVTPGAAESYLKRYHAKLMIHGHTHRPDVHKLNNGLTRIVLGAWHERGNVLVCKPGNNGQLDYQLNFFTKDGLNNDEIL